MPRDRDPAFERRLDELRQQAKTQGRVEGRGVDIAGSPLPISAVKNGSNGHGPNGHGRNGHHGLERAVQSGADKPGYFGMPVIKPPVWTWEIPLYFFFGGMTGMAAVIALAATVFGHLEIVRAAMWIAAFGGVVSPVLLIMDLGRPLLFFNMLRVFKLRSAMSMGVYILTPYGMTSIPGALAVELYARHLLPDGILTTLLHVVAVGLTAVCGLSGMLLATYTGVLIGATAVPAWNKHRALLPCHFGTAGLGSAAGFLGLLGYSFRPLAAIFLVTTCVETGFWLWLMFRRHGAADRALHEGTGGKLLMPAEILLGPVSLGLVALHLPGIAAVCFMLGSLLSRFGWIQAGKQSALDPEAVFASMR